jgi:glycogen synthase
MDGMNKEKWQANVAKAMSTDFGWSSSAKKYVAMYEELLNK